MSVRLLAAIAAILILFVAIAASLRLIQLPFDVPLMRESRIVKSQPDQRLPQEAQVTGSVREQSETPTQTERTVPAIQAQGTPDPQPARGPQPAREPQPRELDKQQVVDLKQQPAPRPTEAHSQPKQEAQRAEHGHPKGSSRKHARGKDKAAKIQQARAKGKTAKVRYMQGGSRTARVQGYARRRTMAAKSRTCGKSCSALKTCIGINARAGGCLRHIAVAYR